MTVAPERRPRAFDSVEDVVNALRETGHRVSTPARLVIEGLFAADGPVSAERLAEGAATGGPALELTSVYRNLERLESLGVVSHVHVGHGAGLYALARGSDREYLVCERCGRVTGVEPAALDEVRETVRRVFGYHARFRHFPIHGHCAECARALEKAGAGAPPRAIRKEHDMAEHEHDHPHTHEHSHGGETHRHPHSSHDHDHTEHEHEHSHGDQVHAHPHVHEAGLEHDHEHDHEEG
jgi:Fur family transcriptional regulator, ferric uptake regulator